MCHFDLGLHCLPMSHKKDARLIQINRKGSMIRKYHNHKQQTNPRHCEREIQNIYSNTTSKRQQKQTHQKFSVAPQGRLRTMFLNLEIGKNSLVVIAFLPVALFLLNNQLNSLLKQASVVPNASLGIFQVL